MKTERNETIADRVLAGESYAALAREYGLTRQRIYQISHGTHNGADIPNRRITGPFYRVCEVCGDRKQYRDKCRAEQTKRCLKCAKYDPNSKIEQRKRLIADLLSMK